MGVREEIAERGAGNLKPNSFSCVSKPSGVSDRFTPKSLSLISLGMACACSERSGILSGVGVFWLSVSIFFRSLYADTRTFESL